MAKKILAIIIIIIAFGVAYWLFGPVSEISNFEDCINAGYPTLESYPRQCKTPDGRTFTEEIDTVELSYNVSGCEIEETKEYTKSRGIEEKVDIEINDGFINLTHYLNYVCCADMKVYLDSVENYPDYTLIKLKEKNEGKMCRCICDYEIDAKIGPFESGKYRIQIWGVEFEDMLIEILWEGEISLL
jgi:hypothetical protein